MPLQNLPIDYQMLAEANKFYKDKGYAQIEVPWVVSSTSSLLTAEMESRVFVTNYNEHFVGSAEQGFIELMLFDLEKKIIPETKYQAISPCFRRDVSDDTHCEWFVKLELYYQIATSEPVTIMRELIRDAKELFNLFNIQVEEVPQADKLSIDLMHGNLELGSYGFRKIQDITYVYGTGLALPRAQLITYL